MQSKPLRLANSHYVVEGHLLCRIECLIRNGTTQDTKGASVQECEADEITAAFENCLEEQRARPQSVTGSIPNTTGCWLLVRQTHPFIKAGLFDSLELIGRSLVPGHCLLQGWIQPSRQSFAARRIPLPCGS